MTKETTKATKYYTTNVVCPITGIATSIAVDNTSSKDFTISALHQFSTFNNSKATAYKGNEYLETLSSKELAGLVIVLYGHHDLLPYQKDSKTSNFLLSTVKKDTLIRAILLSTSFTKRNQELLPQFDLSIETHTGMGSNSSNDRDVDFSENFKSFLTEIKDILKDIGELVNSSKNFAIRGSLDVNNVSETAPVKRATDTMSKELLEKQIEARISYKELAPTLIALDYKKLSTVIKTSLSAETIKTLSEDIKLRIVDRLNEVLEQLPLTNKDDRLNVATIQDFINYSSKKNLVNDTVRAVERASDIFTKPKRTLAEIIASKKQQAVEESSHGQ